MMKDKIDEIIRLLDELKESLSSEASKEEFKVGYSYEDGKGTIWLIYSIVSSDNFPLKAFGLNCPNLSHNSFNYEGKCNDDVLCKGNEHLIHSTER